MNAVWHAISHLSPLSVDQLVSDVELLRQGARVHYCVDPHDMFDFCFPVNPNLARRLLVAGDIDKTANDQTALYELFYVFDQRPLVVPEYSEEAVGLLAYLERFVRFAYTQSEMVQAFIQGAPRLEDATSISGDQVSRSEAELVEVVENAFTLVFAVNFGLLSVGIRRFSELLNSRVSLDPPKFTWRAKRQTLPDFRRSRTTWKLFEELRNARRDDPSVTPFEREKRERADLIDATAIDRLLFMNQQLATAYDDGLLNHRHILLYVSSAAKTERLFRLPWIKDELPRISGHRFSIWRTREQLLAQAACRGSGRSRYEKLSDSLRRLRELREVVDEIEGVSRMSSAETGGRCERCVLAGGLGTNCRLLTFCERVRKLESALDRRRIEIQNLGFMGELERYRKLLDAKPTKRSEKAYVAFFHELFKDSGVKDLAIERSRLIQQLVGVKAVFAKYLPASLMTSSFLEARSGRDSVTSPEQALPLRLTIKGDMYCEILDDVRQSLREPFLGANRLEQAYGKFLHLDAELSEFIADHEMIRCLLYMTSLGADSDERAIDHANRMHSIFTEDESEFAYLEVWALRRIKKFREADKVATEGIRQHPQDPRFFHGRALNAFSWREVLRGACPRSDKDIRADLQAAIDLYEAMGAEDKEIMAALYNSLAYAWCLAERVSRKTVSEARKALVNLKSFKDRAQWRFGFPEYHHTEACVELVEYRLLSKQGERPELLRQKLGHALQQIEVAVNIMPKPRYLALSDEILEELRNIAARSKSH